MAKITVADIHGRDHAFFHTDGGWADLPLVLTNNLCKLDCPVPARKAIVQGKEMEYPPIPGALDNQEILMLTIILTHRYSYAMAEPSLRFLAEKMNLKLRQTRYWLAKLKARGLVNVTERPGRASAIDVSPCVVAVKKLVGWQDAEQPAAEPETPEDVAPEPEPTEEELWWLQAADSEEDAAEEEAEAEEDVGAYLDWQRLVEHIDRHGRLSQAQRRHLEDTKGLKWEGLTLVVQARDKSQIRFLENLDATIRLSVLDVFGLDCDVQFEPVKKPKRAPLLTTLVAATVGV